MNKLLFNTSSAVAIAAFNANGNISDAMRNTMMTTPPAPLALVLAGIGAEYGEDVMLKRSPDSAAMVDYWDKTDDIVTGAKAVRDAREKYLPKFDKEEQPKYEMRLALTKFTNIYRDIVEGLATKPFEEEVSLIDDAANKDETTSSIPQEIKDFIEDVDGSGNNLTVFASLTFFNGINSAIDWIYVDAPKPDPTIRTRADAKAAGIKPYWSHVLGRNVLEARSKVISGKETLVYIRIFEPGLGTADHVRIFERDPSGHVYWALYVKTDRRDDKGQTVYQVEDAGEIGIPLIPLIPFVTGRRDGRTFKVYPPMQDAADLQIELYQQESGLKFIKTLSAYPMLAANGIRPTMDATGKKPLPLAISPMMVLYGTPDNLGNAGSWQFIEPAATSMTFLASDVKDTINQLRELGRQPLTAQSGNLTVITTAVAAGKARSAVGAWTIILKNSLQNALDITAMFMSITYQSAVNVFNEFDDITDNGKDLLTLNSARAARDISLDTYWLELKRRKVLSPEFDGDKEKAKLLEEAPADPLAVDTNLDPATGLPIPPSKVPPAPGPFSTRGM